MICPRVLGFRDVSPCVPDSAYCLQGVSRSAAVVIAYLIYTHNMSYDSAFDPVRRKRACIKPNSGFVQCLQQFEKDWRNAAQRPNMRRASTTPT